MPPLLRLVRPGHWVKSLFVLVAPFFDGALLDAALALDLLLLLVGFSLAASSVYAYNDAADAALDRLHPAKRLRPVAAGIVSPRMAKRTAVLCALMALLASLGAGTQVVPVTFGYLAINFVYSLWLKHVPFLEILMIASGFLLRVVAGAQLTGVTHFSPWLYLCVFFLAILLIMGKRHSELVELGPRAVRHRPSLQRFSLSLTTCAIWLCGLVLGIIYTGYALMATTRVVSNIWMGITAIPVWWGIGYYMKLVLTDNKGGEPASLLWERPLLPAILLVYVTLTSLLIYVFMPGT